MALTRLDNLYSSKTGKYLYVSPDDFNATDELDNRGNSPLRPFKTIQRAFIEVARYSYLPGRNNDRFDQFSIMLMPGNHYIDNRPGLVESSNPEQRYLDAANLIDLNRQEIIDRSAAEIAVQHPDFYYPNDATTGTYSRFKDAYRLIQLNRAEIITTAFNQIAITHPAFVNPDSAKCQRDIGYFIDAVSLDIAQAGGNVYTRKFILQYFDGSGSPIANGLVGEVAESITAFNKARDEMIRAITNQLTVKDLSVTADPATGSNTSPSSCANVSSAITTLTALTSTVLTAGNLSGLTAQQVSTNIPAGELKCRRDIGYIIDAVAADLRTGGNANIISATRAYFDRDGNPINNGLVNEVGESVTAFNKARDMMRLAVTNSLYGKDLSIAFGPAVANATTPTITYGASGNTATCTDVQSTITTLIAIITSTITAGNLSGLSAVQTTGTIPVFNFNRALQEWQDNSILDLSNPDNVLHKFNSTSGGCIVPRGCSLIGYDLRRTVVRPLYVPDPADGNQERTSIFNLTGGCYIWQFTIKDGDLSSNSPLFDATAGVGKVYYQKGNTTNLAIPEFSHHKITIMTYADSEELDRYYEKVGRAFVQFQPSIDDGDFEALVQENRIVGPLSDTRRIESIKVQDSISFTGTAVNTNAAITNVSNVAGLNVGDAVRSNSPSITIPTNTTIISIVGTTVTLSNPVTGSGSISLSATTGKITATVTTKIDHGYFVDQYVAILNSGLDEQINGTFKVYSIDPTNPKVFQYQIQATTSALGLIDGTTYNNSNGLSTNAVAQAEIDSVESASPYVFNCSIRSTWGLCGMWADGAKATGFKSMVVAQYTGVSLQKDDRAFIRYDKFTNTWNQASLTDAFATTPYHTKGDAYWKDDWRNFHIRASDDAFIQCVSVFAVGFFDHFLMESGGDMSITNSNSNFGNTSLHAVGFKGFSFNQDKGGYITDIIPPKTIRESIQDKVQYYTLDIQSSNASANHTRLYLGAEDLNDPANRPSVTVSGYRVGARTDEKLYVKLDNGTYYSTLEPTGFLRYTASVDTLNPSGITVNNLAQDAANLINLNKQFIQNEAYNYILAKYPYLSTRTTIDIATCERDIGYFVDAVVSDLRLGGNINSIQAAEAYFIGGQLTYITNELNESIETYDYVKNMCIAAMRNWDFLIRNCTVTSGSAIVDVGSTAGLLVGMSVKEYAVGDFNADGQLSGSAVQITTAIPANTFIKRILDTTRIELGVSGSKLITGSTVNAIANRTNASLYFEITDGAFSTTKDPQKDTTVSTLNAGYPECASIATTIAGYFTDIFVILNQGLTPLGGREVDAHNLILGNKNLIAEVAVARMLANYPGFIVPGGNQECVDDIVAVIESVAFNIKFGGNNRAYDAANIYVQNPQYLNGEEDQAVYAYTQARDMMIQAMRNQTIVITGSTRTQFIDNSVVADTSSPACADVATAITNLISIVTQGIGTSSSAGNLTGITRNAPTITSVTRVEPVLDIAGLSKRATIFTVNAGGGGTNPHRFETGTPVKLVPRARSGRNPDKRVIRLPNGFDTNTKYYVIAPGRRTQPENYSTTTVFNGSDQTKLMLASTKENAAAGIYIYSPETDSVDPDVEIEIQQYVLDDVYDLHKYTCNLAGAGELQTDVSHIFDLPNAAVTPQRVFFRLASDIVGSNLPEIAASGTISTQTYYFARYISSRRFSIHTTHADAIAGVNAISFVPSSGQDFYVFSDKRRSPIRFDAAYTTPTNTSGLWYVQVKDESSPGATFRSDSILTRFKDAVAYGPGSGKIRTLDTWIQRIRDERTEGDRIYRLRYVIPSYLTTVRDPLNGFVLKTRTDDKRRLVAQKFILVPIGGAPNVARFDNPRQSGEILGQTRAEYLSAGITATYDPYLSAKIVQSTSTQSRIAFSVQSARKVTIGGNQRLELIAFDHTITVDALKNEIFSIVEINAPQGGSFVISNSTATSSNLVSWSGNSNGSGYIQGYFNQGSRHFLVLKNTTGSIVYNRLVNTRFTQGAVYADLVAKPNSVGDTRGRDKSSRKDYLYRIEGANVYTLVPGDIVTDDASNQYRIENVEDVGEIQDSFYIFDIDTIQERIPGQQDGVYYLTCLRGNISPFPQGAGVGANFQNFKFSQPISQLYPQNYKNDPVWFKQISANYNDVPATRSAADNYTHGLVTVNDVKYSETKEMVEDFIRQPALSRFTFVSADTLTTPTLNPAGGSNIIQAQNGNATSGSEDRNIPISGDSAYPFEQRLYVELRRPSIARSGNHTFEYLGFGPGNYSTGFPLRQEVVLSDVQDFYAQSKREDGGIVFYTGLNSNGDLYIGNRKVNAITGEETFLERAILEESVDDSTDSLGALVTTFDVPVTFNSRITVEGDSVFNNPVSIIMGSTEGPALTIPSVIDPASGLDQSISTTNTSSIILHRNRVSSAIYAISPRQVLGDNGQPYTIRTHYTTTLGPTNVSPDQGATFNASQLVSYGSSESPRSGDILLKGDEVGLSGSLGWVYANYFTEIVASNLTTLTSDGVYITFNLAPAITNATINISANSIVRISGFTLNTNLNGNWQVVSSGFSSAGTSFRILPIVPPASGTTYTWSTVVGAKLEVSREKWKEVGVVGAEVLRTNTETWGNYRLGINTLARATDDGYKTAFIEAATTPRAVLDVVGDTFISGKRTSITVAAGVQSKITTNLDNAFIVGGDSATPNNDAVFRVSTTPIPGGRILTVTPSGTAAAGSGLHPSVAYTGGTGTGATFTVNRNAGAYAITIVSPGYNYVAADVITVLGTALGGASPANDLTITVATVSAVGPARGRIGINTNTNQMALFGSDIVAIGSSNFVGDMVVNGSLLTFVGNINTSSSTLDFAATPTTVRIAAAATIIELGNVTAGNQQIDIGNTATQSTVTIGDVATTTVFNLHRNSTNATVDIASVNNTASASTCSITLGGAFANASSLTTIKTRNTYLDGDVQIGSGFLPGTGTGKLYSLNTNFELLAASGGPSNVSFATSASTLQIGSQGGTTTINNGLRVKARADFDGDIKLSGGLNSGGFRVERGVFGTTPAAQVAGGLPSNFNIDLYRRVPISKTLDNPGGSDLTAANTFITLNAIVSPGEINIGDYLLLDESATFAGAPVGFVANEDNSEIVRVTNLTNLSNTADPLGIRVEVQRGVDGTTARIHPDNLPVIKLTKSANVSYTTTAITNTDVIIRTAEFGGSVLVNDYIRINRATSLEFLKVAAGVPALTSIQDFRITDGGAPEVLTFRVTSTTGDTYVRGSTEIHNNLTLVGSTTPDLRKLVVNDGSVARLTTFDVDSANGNTRILGNVNVGTGFSRLTVEGANGNTVINGGNLTINDNSAAVVGATVPATMAVTVTPDGAAALAAGATAPASMLGTDPLGTVIAGAQNRNPAVAATVTLPAAVTAAGITVGSYTIYLEDLSVIDTSTGKPTLHWHLDNIPVPAVGSPLIAANATALPAGSIVRRNYVGVPGDLGVTTVGYSGPQPPAAERHTYRLTVIAVLSGSRTTSTLRQSLEFVYNPAPAPAIAAGAPTYTDNLDVAILGVANQRLLFQNVTGNLTISGLYTSTSTTGINQFNSDLRLNGGDFTVNRGRSWTANAAVVLNEFIYNDGITYRVTTAGNLDAAVAPTHTVSRETRANGTAQLQVYNNFRVNNTGSVDLGGINSFYGSTGARRWEYLNVGSGVSDPIVANISYFVNPSGDLYVRLPQNPVTGDMIRFVDISSNLAYNLKLVLRAPTGISIQGDSTNISAPAPITAALTAAWTGGELIVTTPNAALGLIYAGSLNNDGSASGIPSAQQGWWLMEI